jgi:hypothetical protein
MTTAGTNAIVSDARLLLRPSSVAVAIPQASVRVGVSANSYILLPLPENKDCQVILHSDDDRCWRMCVEGAQGAWVNDHFYTQGHKDIALSAGDILKLGNVQLQFILPAVATGILPSSPEVVASKEQVWLDATAAASSWPEQIPTQEQIATESLRIVNDTRKQRRNRWYVVFYASVTCIFLLLSYAILSRRLVALRSDWLPTTAESPSLASQPVAESGNPDAMWPVTGRWLNISPVPFLFWHGLPEPLRVAQEKMVECFRQSSYAEAERIYQNEIFPYLYASLKTNENLSKYNGLACHWLFLLAQAHNDREIAGRLRQELAVVELQVTSYVAQTVHQEAFRRLIHHLRVQLPLKKE